MNEWNNLFTWLPASLGFSTIHSSHSFQNGLQNVNHITPFLKTLWLLISNSPRSYPLSVPFTMMQPKHVPSQVVCICMFLCLECSCTKSSHDWFLLGTQVSAQMPSPQYGFPHYTYSKLFKQSCQSVPELHGGLCLTPHYFYWWLTHWQLDRNAE